MSYYVDETTGQLVKVTDQHANAETISWGSHSACSGATSTEPCQVTAPDGSRTLTFSYPSAGSGTCPSGSYTCVVVTDPLGRTVTYVKNSSSQLVRISLSNGTTTATYVFTYTTSTNLMTAWWDPQNNSNHSGSTSYATDVTWTSGKVTQVTGPTMTDAGTSMTSTYVPTTTFTYTDFNSSTGNGTVLIDNPNFNQSPAMYGANQTLDTYLGFELVSSVQGYGPLGAYGSYSLAPTPSMTATPMRDHLTLMPEEVMNPLSGGCVGTVGANTGSGDCSGSTEASEYDTGVTQNTYDASGNLLESIAPNDNNSTSAGDTTTNQYNGFNEVTVTVDPIGNASTSSTVIAAHTTTNTYDSTGDLLTSTSPATEDWTSNPETSNYYNSNGTLCASRTADEVGMSGVGVLTSCSATHATTYTYDTHGDLIKVTDPLGDVTEFAYGSDDYQCASLTPDGYAAGGSLTSCPSSAANYETMVLARSLYMDPTDVASPANAAGGNTYTYYNLNDDQIASVSPMGNPSTCNPLSVSTCVYTSYAAFDAMGDAVSSTSQTSASGTQGPTTTSFFDPDGTQVASVSPEGNVSGSASSYEQATIPDNLGDSASQTPASNLGSSCSVTSTTPCPDTTVTDYDEGSEADVTTVSSTGVGSATPTDSNAAYNPDLSDESTMVESSSSTDLLTSSTNDPNGDQLESTSTNAGTTVAGSATAYEPSGATCWTSNLPYGSGTPSCDNPPLGTGNQTTVDYYDADDNLIAVSGPGSNPYATGNSGGCNPLTTSTCSFTTYYTYNEDDELMTTKQPSDYQGNYPVTTNFYDASGNVVAITGAAGNPGSCNPITTSTCTDTTYKSYDGLGRITQTSYTDGTPTVSYSYNNDGTRHQMVDGTGTTTYTYGDLGQLTKKVDGAGNTVSYGYDAAGELICIELPE